MANNNFEFNFSSDDWNDQSSSYVWSEQGGRQYLFEVAKETERFYNSYIKLRHISNHLDFIFMTMQWKHLESRVQNANGGFESNVRINTFHSHPLNIAFTSIFTFVQNIFEISIKNGCTFAVLDYFYLQQTINKAQLNQQEGAYSIDSGDFVLAVCHFKNVISAINDVLRQLSVLQTHQENNKSAANFYKDIKIAMFDIRELAWQAISFCNAVAEN